MSARALAIVSLVVLGCGPSSERPADGGGGSGAALVDLTPPQMVIGATPQ